MMDDEADLLAKAFAAWALAEGDDEKVVQRRIAEYARRRREGESHHQILGLPEAVPEDA